MAMGDFFFRRFPHSNNFNIKVQRNTGEGVVGINGDLFTDRFLNHNPLHRSVWRFCLKRHTHFDGLDALKSRSLDGSYEIRHDLSVALGRLNSHLQSIPLYFAHHRLLQSGDHIPRAVQISQWLRIF